MAKLPPRGNDPGPPILAFLVKKQGTAEKSKDFSFAESLKFLDKSRANQSIYLHRSGPLLENGLDRPKNRYGRYGFPSFYSIFISTVGVDGASVCLWRFSFLSLWVVVVVDISQFPEESQKTHTHTKQGKSQNEKARKSRKKQGLEGQGTKKEPTRRFDQALSNMWQWGTHRQFARHFCYNP